MIRLLIGLVKGLVIGGGVGYGVYQLGLGGSAAWLVYGVIGALVGLLVGRPLWAHLVDRGSTVFTGVLKALFGFGVGVGLWAVGAKALGDPVITALGESHTLTTWWPAFGAIVGGVYGAWVELDDPPKRVEDGKDEKE